MRPGKTLGIRLVIALIVLVQSAAMSVRATDVKSAGELGLSGLAPETQVLVLESDPTAVPAEPVASAAAEWLRPAMVMGAGDWQQIGTQRAGCPDVGFTQRAYARDSGNDWPWLPANTLVADDLTLLPGDWIIDCYDVLIYADNAAAFGCATNRTVTLRAYDACNGAVIPGSEETWTVPPHGGPVLLTGATNVQFAATGTIWFGMTTTSNECDGWYLGQVQSEGSTANVFQLGTDCNSCLIPNCSPYAGFIVVLYGCKVPTITAQPADAAICAGGWHQFCVTAQTSGTAQFHWQKDGVDIPNATSACYVATQAGDYRCMVTDGCSSVTSNAATLTVRTGPVVTSAPVGGISCADHVWNMCVAADAIGTLQYQWKRNGLSIIGATTDCYYATAGGAYTVVVTDDCGSTTSPAGAVMFASPAVADFDGNGVTDISDWELLQPCLAGPGAAAAVDCSCMDTDADTDVDLEDVRVLQSRSGS